MHLRPHRIGMRLHNCRAAGMQLSRNSKNLNLQQIQFPCAYLRIRDDNNENYERWRLIQDITESLATLQENDPDPDQSQHILFDPAEFIRNNPVPIHREFELDGDTLQDLAIKGT